MGQELKEVLAVVTPACFQRTETFIRGHVHHLAPGETVVICSEVIDAKQLNCPHLEGIGVDPWRKPVSFAERIRMALWHRGFIRKKVGRADKRKILNFLETYRVKVVLAEYGPTGYLIADTCRDANVRLYVHIHGYDASATITDLNWVKRYRSLFERADGIITPSQFLADKLVRIGCPTHKLHVNPYGVEITQFRPTRRLPHRVVAVGEFLNKKAPNVTIKAFAKVVKNVPTAELDFVGGGPLMSECRRLAEEYGIAKQVRFHGWQPHDSVARLMNEAALFVQHSVTTENGDTEGLPVAILEAMASAVPVVSTFHSGIPEAVIDGETGILTKEHDVDGMARGILHLLAAPGLAEAMGAAGRRRILQNFTVERSRDRLRAIMGFHPLHCTLNQAHSGRLSVRTVNRANVMSSDHDQAEQG